MKRKFLTVFLLASVSTLAFAQKRTDLSRTIDDNGDKLSIRVYGTVDGREINFDRTFEVKDLSKQERNDLADHVLDSLGLEKMRVPSPPSPPSGPHAPTAPEPPVHLFADDSGSYAPVMVSKNDNSLAHAVGGVQPFIKELKFNPESGQMFMRYRFTKNDEEYTYEKTINVIDKTEQERQKVISDFEKEIELPGKN